MLKTSIDPIEINKFSALSAEWWDASGKLAPLHKLNPTRLTFIRDEICARFQRDPKAPIPFDGLRVLDMGCGAGLLCEPMSRLGAQVIGADASETNIEVAKVHAQEQDLDIDYRFTTAETLAADGEDFDVILNMEVVEHVADLPIFMTACAQMLKPNGLIFVATLNRTAKSFLLAIVGAEYVLGWLPRGTHSWEHFITPDELKTLLSENGLETLTHSGITYGPLTDRWSLSSDLGVNYMLCAAPKKST